MLEYLRIRDLALIEDMALEFGPGMNVLTGETGAGKTFILKAINFLLGEKLTADLIRPGRQKAQVEALFNTPDGDLALKREFVAETGRSRFFINGEISTQEQAKELRPNLVLHVGQHGQQRLLQPQFQAALIDSRLRNPELVAQKDELLRVLKNLEAERKQLLTRINGLQEKRELLEMQKKEIDRVRPQSGEEDELEALRTALRNYEKQNDMYKQGLILLRGDEEAGLLTQLTSLQRLLEALPTENVSPCLEALHNFRIEVAEVETMFRRPPISEDLAGYSPDEIEARLFALAQLKRKLKRTLPEILKLQVEIEENLSFLDVCGLDIQRLDRQEIDQVRRIQQVIQQLNKDRMQAAEDFARQLEPVLGGLGFSEHVRVQPEFHEHQIWPPIGEIQATLEMRGHLLWAPNPGLNPQPMDKIASGGELSRFLLAVVSMQTQDENSTLIFDEVDSGVGGFTLNRVGERLSDLAAKRQMILITHWPQLAAKAQQHFVVTKEIIDNQTFTKCRNLELGEIQPELDRMAGLEKD